MISISGTPTIDNVPKGGGDSFDLMTTLLQARQAADNYHLLAKQAEQRGNTSLAGFWNELAKVQTDILQRTATAIGRLQEEVRKGASDKGKPIREKLKTKQQKVATSKSKAK